MKILPSLVLSALTFMALPEASAHCQVPCGIYDDNARVLSMKEDAQTVQKAATMLAELAGKTDPQSLNQITRWVVTKESHAQKIITSIADYFLTQRVKSSQEDYQERLVKHHAIIVAAMKAKQQADLATAQDLSTAVAALETYYPAKK